MLPYASLAEAEAALGRALTFAETLWFRYSAEMSDAALYFHNTVFLFIIFTLIPLPLALFELRFPSLLTPYKIQPKVHLSPAKYFECYWNVIKIFFLVVCPLQLLSYPTVKVRARVEKSDFWEFF